MELSSSQEKSKSWGDLKGFSRYPNSHKAWWSFWTLCSRSFFLYKLHKLWWLEWDLPMFEQWHYNLWWLKPMNASMLCSEWKVRSLGENFNAACVEQEYTRTIRRAYSIFHIIITFSEKINLFPILSQTKKHSDCLCDSFKFMQNTIRQKNGITSLENKSTN